jgi:hypothetical protein
MGFNYPSFVNSTSPPYTAGHSFHPLFFFSPSPLSFLMTFSVNFEGFVEIGLEPSFETAAAGSNNRFKRRLL